MNSWMKKLDLHYKKIRSLYPEDRLMILFDIDGTILDMRHMILHVLKSFDRSHGASFFKNLRFEDIAVHENQVEKLLTKLRISDENLEKSCAGIRNIAGHLTPYWPHIAHLSVLWRSSGGFRCSLIRLLV